MSSLPIASAQDYASGAAQALNYINQENIGANLRTARYTPVTGFISPPPESSDFKNRVAPAYDKRMRDYLSAAAAGNFDLMISLLRELGSICPDDLRAPYYLAELFDRLHRYSEAGDEYAVLRKRFTDSDAIDRYGRENSSTCRDALLTREANSYQNSGDFNVAMSKFSQVLQSDPANVMALFGLAECQDASGAKAAARSSFLRITSQFPNSVYAEPASAKLLAMEKATRENLQNDNSEHHGCWNFGRPITVYIDSGKGSDYYQPYMRDMVVQALSEWSTASGNRLQFSILPPSPLEQISVNNFASGGRDVVDFQDPINCNIHIIWTDKSLGGHTLGVTGPCYSNTRALLQKQNIAIDTSRTAGGAVLKGDDMALDEAKQARKRSMYFTILHELGHALGLGHLSDSEAIMFYAVFGGVSKDTASRSRLTSHDVRALERHYENFHPGFLAALEMSKKGNKTRSERVELPKAIASTSSSTRTRVSSAVASSVYGSIPNYVPFSGSSASSAEAPPDFADENSRGTASSGESWSGNIMGLISRGDYKNALRVVDSALTSKPNDAEMHYIRGICLTKLKNYRGARSAYERAIKLSPDSKTGSLARKGLEKLN